MIVGSVVVAGVVVGTLWAMYECVSVCTRRTNCDQPGACNRSEDDRHDSIQEAFECTRLCTKGATVIDWVEGIGGSVLNLFKAHLTSDINDENGPDDGAGRRGPEDCIR